MELHRFFRYAIEKMCKEKKSLNHFIKKKNVYKLLREIVDSFYQNEDWLGKVEEVKKKVSSDARLKALFVSCPEERSCKLVDKIKEVQKMMRDFSIYKKDELLSMN